ncbi:MAG: FAD-dependent oxidoreductase [Patescibacteria group bacterium]
MLYDVIIVGGGPAATAAAVYTARKQLKTLVITESFGGQSIVSDDIQNWIGEQHISGFDLAKKFEEHVRSFGDIVEIKSPEKAIKISAIKCERAGFSCDFEVETELGNRYEGKSIIMTAGARRRKLGIPGEEAFNGKGVAYCSTCDAPLFSGKVVAVVGGGNAGLEAIIDLLPYATKTYLLIRGDSLKGDESTQNEIKKNPKVEIIFNAITDEIKGISMVTGLLYHDAVTNEKKELAIGGIFVEIGSVPNSEIVKDLVKIDAFGQIVVDKFSATSYSGIFAAGDITDDPFKQNNISAGDGVKAALSAYGYLLQLKKRSPATEKQ